MSDQERLLEPAPQRPGPWPEVMTRGEIEPALGEWLHTNGTGAYAMSTVALMHTRRHHGMFVAPLDPPLDRHVILSHAETRLETQTGKVFTVSTHQFPGMAPTPGYRHLHAFHQDPLPRWVYRFQKLVLERRLCLVRGANALVLSYTWYGRWPAKLSLKPLLALRPARDVVREHGAMVQRVVLRRGLVDVQPEAHLPPVLFGHRGVFVGSPAWWRRFEYTDDPQRGEPSIEDLWTPGHFELVLEPGVPKYLVVGLGALPQGDPGELVAEAERHLLAQDPGPEQSSSVRVLSVAADHFIADQAPRPAIIAGYPFYDVRTRDVLIATTGLLLARGRIETAQRVVQATLGDLHAGLLPERRPERASEPVSPSVDATLWLFELARQIERHCGALDPFVNEHLYPALVRAFVSVRSGRARGVWLAAEGGLVNGLPDVALTWMSARARDRLVTPRRGLAVELQALWSRAADTLALLAQARGDTATAEAAAKARDDARVAFARRFWCNGTSYPYDCISEEESGPEAFADASIRPNALIALAVDPEAFERWQAVAIVERVRRDLLTPYGIRSLTPHHPDYLGVHVGPPEDRESSYHQGTAWTWLFGCYARAALRLAPDDFELREELRVIAEKMVGSGPIWGQVAQLADGDEPHRPRGCPAQAWSVAELLRTLLVDLDG